VPAAPQPGQVPQPPQGQQPAPRAGGAAAAVGAHIQNMNAQLAQLHNLNQNIADTLQRLQRQHNNNLVPNQLQYQPPVGGAWPAPPAAAPAAAPVQANGHAVQQQQPNNLAEMQERMAARIAEYRRMRQLPQPAAQEPATAEPAAPQPGSIAEPPSVPAQTTNVSNSLSAPGTTATQPTEQRPATSPATETPATPSPAPSRPAQASDAPARSAAYEAAQRRLAALRGAHSPSAASIVPRPAPAPHTAGLPAQNSDTPVAIPPIPTPTIPAEGAPAAGPSSAPIPAPTHRTTATGTAEAPPAGGLRVARGPQFGLAPTKNSTHGVPGAIPLYDPSHAHVPGYPMLSFQQAVSTSYVGVPQAHYVRAPFPTPRTFANESSTPRGPPFMQGLAGPSPFGVDGQRGRPATPLNELPSRLSSDQLATLDHTTREAIDERLRMLDSVQATLQRCTDELLRVQSVLPPPTIARVAAATRTSEPPSISATQSNISELAQTVANAISTDVPTSDSLLQEVTQLLERRAAGTTDQAQRERVQNAIELLQAAQTARAPAATANGTSPSGYAVPDHAAAASSTSRDETSTPEPDAPSS